MKRHTFDAISFVFGLAFLVGGLAFSFAGTRLGDLDPALAWIVPTLLVGVTALLVGIGRLRSSGPPEASVDDVGEVFSEDPPSGDAAAE